MRCPQPRRVRVVRESEDRNVGPGIRHLVRIYAREVTDDQVGRVHVVGRDQLVRPAQERIQLSSKEEIDPRKQDRRHARERTITRGRKQGLC